MCYNWDEDFSRKVMNPSEQDLRLLAIQEQLCDVSKSPEEEFLRRLKKVPYVCTFARKMIRALERVTR